MSKRVFDEIKIRNWHHYTNDEGKERLKFGGILLLDLGNNHRHYKNGWSRFPLNRCFRGFGDLISSGFYTLLRGGNKSVIANSI